MPVHNENSATKQYKLINDFDNKIRTHHAFILEFFLVLYTCAVLSIKLNEPSLQAFVLLVGLLNAAAKIRLHKQNTASFESDKNLIEIIIKDSSTEDGEKQKLLAKLSETYKTRLSFKSSLPILSMSLLSLVIYYIAVSALLSRNNSHWILEKGDALFELIKQ